MRSRRIEGEVMQLPEFLEQLEDGEIRLAGHRIGLFHLVQNYNEGESAEMLASCYPTLPLALVHKVIAFYLDHQKEMDAYLNACDAAIDEQRNSSRRLDLSALRQRLADRPQSAASAEHPV